MPHPQARQGRRLICAAPKLRSRPPNLPLSGSCKAWGYTRHGPLISHNTPLLNHQAAGSTTASASGLHSCPPNPPPPPTTSPEVASHEDTPGTILLTRDTPSPSVPEGAYSTAWLLGCNSAHPTLPLCERRKAQAHAERRIINTRGTPFLACRDCWFNRVAAGPRSCPLHPLLLPLPKIAAYRNALGTV